jgi:predicted phage terminase large subunit-like protein
VKTKPIQIALRRFRIFVQKVFHELNPNEEFTSHEYIRYLCYWAQAFADGTEQFQNINLAPRHLKTLIFSKALPAYLLARDPSLKIMIFTGNEALAREIPSHIRQILRAPWYMDAFRTRIARDNDQRQDFRTTDGGACFTTTIGANFTGKGGDVLIVDDANGIKDARNELALAKTVECFETEIRTRLNNQRTGRILNVQQRLSNNDLAGHLIREGGFKTIALEMVATKSVTLEYGGRSWRRERGELLQGGSMTRAEIERARARPVCPDFDTEYQQNPMGTLSEPITTKCFRTFLESQRPAAGVVLSVDPGQERGPDNSYSVIQAWCRHGKDHFLLDQVRARLELDELFSNLRQLRLKYQARAVLIERTALGSALISKCRDREWKGLYPIVPDGRSKVARLRPHLASILAGHIRLPAGAAWAGDLVVELVAFPNGDFDDQVDAMTQYLDSSQSRTDLPPAPERGGMAVALYSRRRW